MAGAADYAVRRALQQSPEQAQAASQQDFGGAVHPVGNAFGVTNTPGYQGEATQRAQQIAGNMIGKGVNAVAGATGLPQQDVSNMAGSLSLLVPEAAHLAAPLARGVANEVGYAASAAGQGLKYAGGAIGDAATDAARTAGQTAVDFGNAVGTVTGLKGPEAPALTNEPVVTGAPGRGSVGAAVTSFSQQAAA